MSIIQSCVSSFLYTLHNTVSFVRKVKGRELCFK